MLGSRQLVAQEVARLTSHCCQGEEPFVRIKGEGRGNRDLRASGVGQAGLIGGGWFKRWAAIALWDGREGHCDIGTVSLKFHAIHKLESNH